MSLVNVEKFYQEAVQHNEDLQRQMEAAQDIDNFKEVAVRLGEEKGYTFTIEEVNAFINQKIQESNFELSDKELESVAGGTSLDEILDPFLDPDGDDHVPKECPQDTSITFCFFISSCWGSAC